MPTTSYSYSYINWPLYIWQFHFVTPCKYGVTKEYTNYHVPLKSFVENHQTEKCLYAWKQACVYACTFQLLAKL